MRPTSRASRLICSLLQLAPLALIERAYRASLAYRRRLFSLSHCHPLLHPSFFIPVYLFRESMMHASRGRSPARSLYREPASHPVTRPCMNITHTYTHTRVCTRMYTKRPGGRCARSYVNELIPRVGSRGVEGSLSPFAPPPRLTMSVHARCVRRLEFGRERLMKRLGFPAQYR